MKAITYFAVFIGISVIISKLATIHGKQIPAEYFINGYPSILGLLDSELFMGIIFVITLTIVVYVIWLLWGLHEVAVHKAQAMASQQIQLVFALSLCGLFIHKAWWVLAVIIAFTRWDLLAHKISEIIANGRTGEKK
ncbi:magnesium transporter [Psychromonas sp. psych-6C06]|nr:magnesium transporter [Psychromonas sp. psych-6C06]